MNFIRHDSGRVCVSCFPPPLSTNHQNIGLWWWRRIRDAHSSRREHEQYRDDGERYRRPHNLDCLVPLGLLRIAFVLPPSGETHPCIGNDANNDRENDYHHDNDNDGQIENRASLRRLRVEYPDNIRNEQYVARQLRIHDEADSGYGSQRKRENLLKHLSDAQREADGGDHALEIQDANRY